MKRKEFIKRLGSASLSIPLLSACSEADTAAPCTLTASETAGPFPTKAPSSLAFTDIRSDRSGVPLTVELKIQNRSNGCNPLANTSVDIWHCDKDGSYSEYGGTGMQSADYTAVHFLRGRQVTDADGVVRFTSIFPGWYSGRAPHIHVHIYDASGASLLVTQIAFPKSITDEVYTKSALYSSRGKQDTTNDTDNVFRDGVSTELAGFEGSIDTGYSLKHTISVDA